MGEKTSEERCGVDRFGLGERLGVRGQGEEVGMRLRVRGEEELVGYWGRPWTKKKKKEGLASDSAQK